MTLTRFTEIRAWQSARELVREVYRLTGAGALQRDFALRDQLRRAAVSGMSNIAEGFGRGTDADFARFLDMARGSLAEVQSLLIVCSDIGVLTTEETTSTSELADKAIAQVAKFQTYLRANRVGEVDGQEIYQP